MHKLAAQTNLSRIQRTAIYSLFYLEYLYYIGWLPCRESKILKKIRPSWDLVPGELAKSVLKPGRKNAIGTAKVKRENADGFAALAYWEGSAKYEFAWPSVATIFEASSCRLPARPRA